MATPIMGKAREEYSACPRKTRAMTMPKMARPATPAPTAISPSRVERKIRSRTPCVSWNSLRSKYMKPLGRDFVERALAQGSLAGALFGRLYKQVRHTANEERCAVLTPQVDSLSVSGCIWGGATSRSSLWDGGPRNTSRNGKGAIRI